jgi:hypothetical protein
MRTLLLAAWIVAVLAAQAPGAMPKAPSFPERSLLKDDLTLLDDLSPALDQPLPGPHHAVLKDLEGTWDFVAVTYMDFGVTAVTNDGVAENRLVVNDLWLVTDFKTSILDVPYRGHEILGFDVVKGRYVGTWVDSMSTSMMTSEGTYDEATRTLTLTMKGRDGTGAEVVMKGITRFIDKDHHAWTAKLLLPDGEEIVTMEIRYERRPSPGF